MDLYNIMMQRRSVRSYSNKSIPEPLLKEILEVAQRAPTSINAQGSSVIVVRDLESRKEIRKLCGDQGHIEEAPVFLLFLADFNKTEIACEINGRKQEIVNSPEGFLVGAVDASISMQNAVIYAEAKGLSSVCIGAVRNLPKEISTLLDLPKHTYPVCGLCLGYKKEEVDHPKQKPRMAMKGYAFYEKYNKQFARESVLEYDAIISDWFSQNDRNAHSWSNRISKFYDHSCKPNFLPFLKENGFDFII